MKKLHYLLFAMIMGLAVSFTSCSSDNDSPLNPVDPVDPTPELPVVNKTMAELIALAGTDAAKEITEDVIFEGIVISNDLESDNFYTKLYIQSGDLGVLMSVAKADAGETYYKDFTIGQKVVVKAKGLHIGFASNAIILGQGADDKYTVGRIADKDLRTMLFKAEGGADVTPKALKLSEITDAHLNTLVTISGVQFVEGDLAKNYGKDAKDDGTFWSNANRTLTDIDRNTIIIRSSQYAKYAETTVAQGSGSITAILSKFNDDYQLYIRDIKEVSMEETRFEFETVTAPTANKTIADIKALVTGADAVEVTEEFAFDAVVTSNQGESGNFYKSLYVQDETGALKISCNGAYEDYTIGQKVVVSLKGKFIGVKNGTYMVGSAADDKYVVKLIADADVPTTVFKLDGGVAVEPTTVALDALTDELVGSLVKFDAVQVLTADLEKAITAGIMLTDANGNKIKLYVSTHADALKAIATPQKSGSVAGILYKAGDDYSLTLRLESEIDMTADRFDDGSTGGETGGEGIAGVNAGTYTGSAATELFISEYLEGGSSNKYLELFNGTGADIDLSGYSIKLQANENTDWGDAVALAGILPNGATFVIANSSAVLTLNDGVTVDITASKATYFNGNDRVGLFKGETLIDMLGVIADADGNGKTDNFAANVTLVRKATVTSPVTTWDSAEWTVNGKEDIANLGSHTMD